MQQFEVRRCFAERSCVAAVSLTLVVTVVLAVCLFDCVFLAGKGRDDGSHRPRRISAPAASAKIQAVNPEP